MVVPDSIDDLIGSGDSIGALFGGNNSIGATIGCGNLIGTHSGGGNYIVIATLRVLALIGELFYSARY